ncbi:hypothetical protein [Vibrio metoecus]|uniref:hypothetical protein n=1 Tax=Vibrio metoecus TaxID=1481663 RepID=UPI003D687DC3
MNTAIAQQKHARLQVRFQQFNGSYTGNAEIAGSWELGAGSSLMLRVKDGLAKSLAFRYHLPMRAIPH